MNSAHNKDNPVRWRDNYIKADDDEDKDTKLRPFEWLTSAESLHHLLTRALCVVEKKEIFPPASASQETAVLHVGCGSSVLGEFLVLNYETFRVDCVINVDCDGELLRRMQDRWNTHIAMQSNNYETTTTRGRMEFVTIDFTNQTLTTLADASVQLVVDKSTLDCLLCTDRAATGLLCEAYRVLKPGGIYLIVTFHETDFIVPLLERLPRAEWDVTVDSMTREMEDLIGMGSPKKVCAIVGVGGDALPTRSDDGSAWKSGTFAPDEGYRRSVNVIQCRKRLDAALDAKTDYLQWWEDCQKHVHAVNHEWYSDQNPMLSRERIENLEKDFAGGTADLRRAYGIVFTDAEREHFEFNGFLEDWNAFLETHPDLPTDYMTCATAIAFVRESQ